MLKVDKEAVLCDFAETYHIYDLSAFPLRYIAMLCVGLRDSSRIKMKLAETKIDTETLLNATIIDQLNILIWMNTEDATKGKNRPKSVVEQLTGKLEENQVKGFDSAEEFELRRQQIMKGVA